MQTNSPSPGKLMDRPTWIMIALLAGLVVVEVLFARHYRPVFPWHGIPGYMGAIGLFSCLGVVWLSKRIGKLFLQRPEDDDDAA
jgi:H+/Cl- antiporter ClcA